MIKSKNLGILIIFLMIFTFSCGGSGDNTTTNSSSSEKALTEIQSFASNNDASSLTTEQLTTTGVTGVVEGNLSEYKSAIANQSTISDLSVLQSIINNVNNMVLDRDNVQSLDPMSFFTGGEPNVNSITNDLNLPATAANGSTITWKAFYTSDNTDASGIVSSSGKVTQPASGEGNASIILIATVTNGGISDSSTTFNVIILEEKANWGTAILGKAKWNP